ncbi:hypothetical protein [Aquimarina algiphila]|uniref:hypothetical protein n=1 Tax=Aquimarina algiphila TaxID=2047982 RepID=UPI00248FFD2E|nr:hypothetical protein [Aquimarina algiphila]
MLKNKKKIFYRILFIWFLVSTHNIYAQKKYRVIEIDSTENFYFVTIKYWFKKGTIVSPKNKKEIHKSKIKVGERHLFKLKTYDSKKIILGQNYSFAIEGKILWYSDKEYNIYTSESLKGLYLDK